MTCEDFEKMKKKAYFYNKIVLVCEECLYQNNSSNYLSGAEVIPSKKLENLKKQENFHKNLQVSLENMKVVSFRILEEIKLMGFLSIL